MISPWSWQDAFGFAQAHEITGAGRTIYCAGQAATDDVGRPLYPGDMRRQTERALDNLEVVLHAAGARFADVVRLNYYTTDVPALFDAWDLITARLAAHAANDSRPASALLGVQGAGLPRAPDRDRGHRCDHTSRPTEVANGARPTGPPSAA